MNPFEFVIAIVAIVTIGNIIRTRQLARHGIRSRGLFGRHGDDESYEAVETAETSRLREEVKALKERIQVLERITVEKEDSLSRQIEELRDR